MISEELVKLASQKKSTNYAPIGSLVGAYQYRLLYKLFENFVPKDSKVLDWGTGNGHFSYFLSRSGYRAVGFSMENFTFRSWVKDDPNYQFVKGEIDEPIKLPFKNNFFDCVVSVGVLEHVFEFGGNEAGSMREISRILKNKGLFICYHLPNYYSLIEFLGKLLTNKFHHSHRFTQEDIRKLTKDNGSELISTGRYGFLPRNSFQKLPKSLKFSKKLAILWDCLDNLLISLFPSICQNYYFVAKIHKE